MYLHLPLTIPKMVRTESRKHSHVVYI